jgi:hypothetical protein
LSSIGVKPSNFAQRCALVVFPIPGEPVIMTARNTFIPYLPGFLNPDFKLEGLHNYKMVIKERDTEKKKQYKPVVQPLLQLLYLTLVATDLLQRLWGISCRPKLRRQICRL